MGVLSVGVAVVRASTNGGLEDLPQVNRRVGGHGRDRRGARDRGREDRGDRRRVRGDLGARGLDGANFNRRPCCTGLAVDCPYSTLFSMLRGKRNVVRGRFAEGRLPQLDFVLGLESGWYHCSPKGGTGMSETKVIVYSQPG